MSKPPRFVWKTSDGAEHTFEMNANEIAIGRAPTCDIVIPDDQMVSRRHAICRKQGMTVTIVDLGSSNGTLVNGVEIRDQVVLKTSDRLMIGDQELTFYAAEADVVQPAFAGNSSFGGTQQAQPAPSFFQPSGPVSFNQPFNSVSEQSTGELSSFQGFTPAPAQPVPPAAPQRQDAAALLDTIQGLNRQLQEQIATAMNAAETIRSGIRVSLSQLDSALQAAQSTSQQAALRDLQQVATTVIQQPMMEQVATFARRAGEIRDVIAAHEQLITQLNALRQQLNQTLNH